MPFLNIAPKPNLSGKTLIVPVVSTANVAQLSVDLLISSLGLVRTAVLDSKYFIPLVGCRENSEPGITTPFELYGKDGFDVVLLQQRAPTLKAMKQEFINDLFDFVQESGIAGILILCGVDLSNRSDEQMSTPTYQLQPIASPLSSTPLYRLNELPIPKYTSPVLPKPGYNNDDSQIPFIPGGGITRRMLSSLPTTWSIPLAALLRFALDGDNRADAYSLASIVLQIIGINLSSIEWKQPESWSGLFGTPHDQSLYG